MITDRIKFLDWLINRLVYKHLYAKDHIVIKYIYEIKDDLIRKQKCDIDDDTLDKILSHYYIDFNLEASADLKLGFSNTEREQLRSMIRNIVVDVNNKIIRKPLLQG